MPPTPPSFRALVRLQEQLAAANDKAATEDVARAVIRAKEVAVAAATADDVRPLSAERVDDSEQGGNGNGEAVRLKSKAEPPKAAWHVTNATAAAAAQESVGEVEEVLPVPEAVASCRILRTHASYEDDDVDNLSTVITPPLPLAAF